MTQDKFTNIYRLPSSIQIRIGKWQQTFKGTSDLVLHNALQVRNKRFKSRLQSPSGWTITEFDRNEISFTHHGKYIQTPMRTMLDRRIAYKRLYLSKTPLEKAEPYLMAYKKEWIDKHNRIARKYNQIKLKEFLRYAEEELETIYPSIPKASFDTQLWNKLVVSELGNQKKYSNPFYVKNVKLEP